MILSFLLLVILATPFLTDGKEVVPPPRPDASHIRYEARNPLFLTPSEFLIYIRSTETKEQSPQPESNVAVVTETSTLDPPRHLEYIITEFSVSPHFTPSRTHPPRAPPICVS